MVEALVSPARSADKRGRAIDFHRTFWNVSVVPDAGSRHTGPPGAAMMELSRYARASAATADVPTVWVTCGHRREERCTGDLPVVPICRNRRR